MTGKREVVICSERTADLAHNRDYADGYHDLENPLAWQEVIT